MSRRVVGRRAVACAASVMTVAAGLLPVAVPRAATAAPAVLDASAMRSRLVNTVLAEVYPAPGGGQVRKQGAGVRSGRTDMTDGALMPAAPAPSSDCDDVDVGATWTNDQILFHRKGATGPAYTIDRQREGGSWRRVGVLAPDATSLRDTRQNPRGGWHYRIAGGGLTCTYPAFGSMYAEAGRSQPDAAIGGVGATHDLMEQGVYDYAQPIGRDGFDPRFSPDGHRLASVHHDAGSDRWSLQIGDTTGTSTAPLLSWTAPAARLPLHAAWSPDGQHLAFTLYTISDDHTATEPELHVVDSITMTDEHTVTGSADLTQPDWVDATTLVAAGWVGRAGLATIPVAGGTATPVTGTVDAAYPDVMADGVWQYVRYDGSDSEVMGRAPDGSIVGGVPLGGPDGWFEQPRTSPDGTRYVAVYDPGDAGTGRPANIQVIQDWDVPVSIGFIFPDTIWEVFSGYDVRQPQSKGTSDFASDPASRGDDYPDILGKDGSGRLWAYYATETRLIGGRVSMGGGWNMFNTVVAAGDLDGDGRADIVGRTPDGTLWMYHGLGGGKLQPGRQVGSGWSSYVIVAPGDFDGDGRADLLGRDSSYRLWLYPGKGDGTFGTRSLVTTGWGGFSSIIGFGDFDFDGKADILGVERSTGYLYLYPGDGAGGVTGRQRIGAGWNTLNAFAAPEFHARTPGLFGRLADGTMRYYEDIGDGRFDAAHVSPAGAGWTGFQITG